MKRVHHSKWQLASALSLLTATSIGAPALAQTSALPDRTTLPVPPSPFSGSITPDYRTSTAKPASSLTAPQGAPNVLLILLDDAGYSQTATLRWPYRHSHA